MQSLTKSTPTARKHSRAPLLFCAALLSAGLALGGCDEDDDPFEGIFSPAEAGVPTGTAGGTGGATGGNVGVPGGNAGTTGGNTGLPGGNTGTTGGNTGLPGGNTGTPGGNTGTLDGGTPVGNDASVAPTGDGGTVIVGSDGGVAGDAASGDASTLPPRADLGKGDGSDVVMMGDSWMSLGGAESGIQGGILKASMQPYRAVAFPGTTLLGGGAIDFIVGAIPTQWQTAVSSDPDIKTVIMTAGGNDILQTDNLQADCMNMGEACGAQVMKILDGLTKLWGEMAKANVQDIVYILYATPEDKSVDFLLPDGDGARKRCAAVPAPTRCHIVETLDIVMGDIPDNIHPSQAASDRIGKAVVDLMAAQGMRR